MWKDSETELDFLDYDYLIKTLQSIVKNDSLLPASIGVYGDWGSGKSSLMYMCKDRLEAEDPNIKCLVFNGWLFENYEDAKIAILGSILDEISSKKEIVKKAKDTLKGLYESVDKFKLIKGALKAGADFWLTGGIGAITEITAKQVVKRVAKGAQEVSDDVDFEKIKEAISDEINDKELRDDIRKFQKEFAKLLDESKISRMVVFVDELDRCRPDTILDTLEAIKLFLFEGKVAFVIGADERHISYAVKNKFKDIEGIQIDIGKEYLEKLIQYPIRIPRLNADEVETYIACLLLESELKPDVFAEMLEWANEQKKIDFEKFKIGTVAELFKESSDVFGKVTETLAVANQLSSVLSNGLHGNPRQCKRFLNSMYMRLEMATYKNKRLDRKILAKIMMLEYIKPRVFNKISDMAATNSLSKELEMLENEKLEELSDLKLWRDDEWFLDWCKLEPHLSGKDLNIYFYFTRTSLDEKISRISSILSPAGKNVLDMLMSKSDIKVKNAIEQAKDISDSEAASILEAMNSSLSAETSISKEHISAFLEFAKSRKELVSDTLNYLQSLSGSQISLGCVGYIVDYGKTVNKCSEVREIAELWGKTNSNLQKALDPLLKE